MTVVPLRAGGIIPGIVEEPDEELISWLERLLEDAKSGHLRAAAYVAIDRDRAVSTGWAGHANDHDMMAGVNLLAFRYMCASSAS